jgi:hypothetical protein
LSGETEENRGTRLSIIAHNGRIEITDLQNKDAVHKPSDHGGRHINVILILRKQTGKHPFPSQVTGPAQ